MRLDSGVCTVFAKQDVSEIGEMPRYDYALKTQSYYAEIDFSTDGNWTTQGREDVVIDARIRIIQDRTITQNDVVMLEDAKEIDLRKHYAVERAFHGIDEESGIKISDLSLRRVSA